MSNIVNRFIFSLTTFSIVVFSSVVSAQNAEVESQLEDFIHYCLIANVDQASGAAVWIINDEISDEDFYKIVTETKERRERFDRAIGWAMYVSDLEPLAANLENRFETGRTNIIRNAARIQESIDLLQGTTRQRILAEKRLKEAGEYAVPALLKTLHNSTDTQTLRTVREMLVSIQRDAVLPLSVALPHLDSNSKVLVVKVLGEIGYKHAAPALIEMLNDAEESPAVLDAVKKTLGQLEIAEDVDPSVLNTVVANQFFEEKTSVMPQPIGGANLFWEWDSQQQLVPLDVPQEVFGDVMAMYFASQALGLNPENESAMSVFVAANLRRDRDLAGQNDLVYGNLPYSPEFYATVFGPKVAQLVLDVALARSDSALALEAISALSETAGAESLLSGEKPLIKAMFYPDRRVQYEAALTLASTLPTISFSGSYRVVPLLASAVRSGGDAFAIVVGEDPEQCLELSAFLDTNGWIVAGQGSTATEAIQAAGVVPGIDLAVVLSRNSDHGVLIAQEIGSSSETAVTPTFVLTSGGDAQVLANGIGGRDMIETADAAVSDSAKLSIIEDLLGKASGGRLSYEEQLAFSARALEILRDIALANTVLQVDDATGTLIEALTTSDPESQIVIAQTLAMIDDENAQQALITAALEDGELEHRVMLLDEAASSVRRWGNNAQDWQMEMVIDLAENANGYLADAAARLNGALDHPNTSIMTFIP
jgi:hypothetical protein